jgi:Amt family ammonium transporter
MELRVNEVQLPAPITFNYEELKQEIVSLAEQYRGMVYTDEQIDIAKADKARLNKLKKALNDLGVTGMTVTQVMGCGVQKGAGERYRGIEMDATLLPKVKVEVVVSKIPVEDVVEAAKKALYTGHIGDGKIFVYGVDKVIKVRTGEEDVEALADVE